MFGWAVVGPARGEEGSSNDSRTPPSHKQNDERMRMRCRYLCYLMFQLKTHKDLFASEESEDQPALSLAGALLLLSTITVIVAVCSECVAACPRRGEPAS